MAIPFNIAALATALTIGSSVWLGIQDPTVNTQVAFPKKSTSTPLNPIQGEVAPKNTAVGDSNSILAISGFGQDAPQGTSTQVSPRQSVTVTQVAPKPPVTMDQARESQVRRVVVTQDGNTRMVAPRFEVVTQDPDVLAGKAYDKKVSIRFNNSPIDKVIGELVKQGISFAMDDDRLPKGKRLTLNAVDKRIGDVLFAIGEALGGHWVERKGFLIFKPGMRMAFNTQFDANEMQLDMGKFQMDMENFAKEMEKDAKSGRMKAFRLEMDGPGKFKMLKDMEIDREKKVKILKAPAAPKPPVEAKVQADNVDKFLASLTPAQLEKHKANGYLVFSDLTPEQVKMLGVEVPEGASMEMVFVKDGNKFVIKSK